jgi:hypothetical protein
VTQRRDTLISVHHASNRFVGGYALGVSEPKLISRVKYTEENGSVTVFERGTLPFPVARAFVVSAASGQVRGAHAHRECWQALFALDGSVEVEAVSGTGRWSFRLEPDSDGLIIPPLVWATQKYTGRNPQLLVLCNETFSEADYVRSFDEFQLLLGIR